MAANFEALFQCCAKGKARPINSFAGPSPDPLIPPLCCTTAIKPLRIHPHLNDIMMIPLFKKKAIAMSIAIYVL